MSQVNDDIGLLLFLHEQMVDIHGEDPEQLYMHRLREIIGRTAGYTDVPSTNNIEELKAWLSTLGKDHA